MSDTATPSPLVVTLTLDAASQAGFDALRRAHFPPDRLHVGAHVTLFHALPGAEEPAIARVLAEACAGTSRFAVAVTGLRFLGRGVAFSLAAPPASALRARLAATFAGWLTPQDRAPWSPHVTVQNKVSPEVARHTHALLASVPLPEPAWALGVALWRYRGGPWQSVAAYPFKPPN